MDNNDNNLNSDAEITGDKPTQEQQIEDAAAMSAKVEALLVALRTPVGGSVSDSNPGPESEAVLEPISDSISDSISEPISEPTADSEYLSSPAPMSEPESVPTFESAAVAEPEFAAISAPETATQPEPTSAQDPLLQTEPELQPQPEPEPEPQTESESASETEPQLPPHLESIPVEKIKRAKRTKTILIVIITLLILAFLGMGALAVYVFTNQQSTQSTIKTSLQIETAVDDSKAQDRGTIQVIESPNLVQMFGKTTDQIIEQLGSNYASTKTETIQEQDNPEVKQLATITYSHRQASLLSKNTA
ncbi:hypothetical protein FACS1894104_5240 [Actinomycetota bacterium]|nr:hypothetical protein FACS1894104_5240 [Actinomycetota bacterium]